jgi:hypothetical protein
VCECERGKWVAFGGRREESEKAAGGRKTADNNNSNNNNNTLTRSGSCHIHICSADSRGAERWSFDPSSCCCCTVRPLMTRMVMKFLSSQRPAGLCRIDSRWTMMLIRVSACYVGTKGVDRARSRCDDDNDHDDASAEMLVVGRCQGMNECLMRQTCIFCSIIFSWAGSVPRYAIKFFRVLVRREYQYRSQEDVGRRVSGHDLFDAIFHSAQHVHQKEGSHHGGTSPASPSRRWRRIVKFLLKTVNACNCFDWVHV